MKPRVNSSLPHSNVGSVDDPKIRVLCVDDEANFLKTTQQILEHQNSFHVETASSVNDALQMITNEAFDVVVSDYSMPERSGLDFLQELKQNGNDIPFILFTGKGREEVAINALNLGADRYFNKIGDPETVYGELAYGIRQAVAQRRAEQKIWDREERIRAMFASSPDVMIVTDLKGVITDCNLQTLKLMQVTSRADLIGKNYRDLVVKDDHGKTEDSIKELYRYGHIKNMECRILTKKGFEISIDYSANILRDAYGKIVGAVGIARDITEQKQLREQLKESEKTYKLLTENITDAIFIQDMSLRVKYVSPAIEVLSGYTPEEILELKTEDFMTPESYQRGVADFMNAISLGKQGRDSEIPLIQYEYIRKDGSTFWGELRTNMMRNSEGNLIGLQGTLRDITDRKKAEEALRSSEKRFRELSELLPETIYETDCKSNLTFVNKEAFAKFGYPEEGFMYGLSAFQLIAPEDHDKVKKNFAKLMRGEKVGPQEYMAIRKDASTFPIIVESVPIIRDDKFEGIRGIMVDISDRKKAEDTLKETLKELEKTNDKLGVVGKITRHDTRNKLSVIINHIYLAKQDLTNPVHILTNLEDIELAVYQIEKLLGFLRIYEKLGTEERSYVSVKKSVAEAISLLSSLEGIDVRNEFDNLTVLADSLLRQVFYNLIENSMKHGENVTNIRTYYSEDELGLKLIYEDDGVGIPIDEKELIFNEGYGKGTGYGLFLIKKICEAYGWGITEKGTLGKGAKFVMTLPKLHKNGKISYKNPKQGTRQS